MGLYSNAELVWGIPVLAYDEDTGEPTPFWSEANEDWIEFDGDLVIRQYGHYEDPDNQRGILTSRRVEPITADCWTPRKVSDETLIVRDKVVSQSNDELHSYRDTYPGVSGVDFYTDAAWWLVASFG